MMTPVVSTKKRIQLSGSLKVNYLHGECKRKSFAGFLKRYDLYVLNARSNWD